MKAVFKTRSQWFYCKQVPDEPNPDDYSHKSTVGKMIDWSEFDLAKKNYELEIKECKRYAVRLTNDWVLEELFYNQEENIMHRVEIKVDVIIRKVEKYIPVVSPSTGTKK